MIRLRLPSRPRALGNSSLSRRLPVCLLGFLVFSIAAVTVPPHAAAADTVVGRDEFSRSLSGSWGSAAVGGRYGHAGPSDAFAVNGAAGTILVRRAGTFHSAMLPAAVARDVDMTASFSIDRIPRTKFSQIGLLVRAVDQRTHYHLVVRMSYTGAINLRLVKRVGSTETLIGRPAVVQGTRGVAGAWYQLRFRAVGGGPTNLQAKLWRSGTAEPSGWTLSRSDNALALRSAGGIGLRAYVPSYGTLPIRFAIDNLVVRATQVTSAPAAPRGDYLLMPRAELLRLSTSSAGWRRLKEVADGPLGTANLCDQDNRHGSRALAAALVYARTGTSAYYSKARNAIMSAIGTVRVGCNNAILALGRQLGAYVLAADFIGLSGADNTTFRNWLSAIRTRDLGGHGKWRTLSGTHRNAPNNWGAFAGGSRIAASLYLGDSADVAAAAKVLRGFLGDRSAYAGFGAPTSEAMKWSCTTDARVAVPTNPTCTRGGVNVDGAIIGDISRDDLGRTWPVGSTGIQYTLESLQGLSLQTELLHRNGYAGAWSWSNSALRRVAGLVSRNASAGGAGWNRTSVDKHVPWLLNFRYGTSLPREAAGYGRLLGYTDWLYGGQ